MSKEVLVIAVMKRIELMCRLFIDGIYKIRVNQPRNHSIKFIGWHSSQLSLLPLASKTSPVYGRPLMDTALIDTDAES